MSHSGSWDHGKVREWRTLHGADAEDGSEAKAEGNWQYVITEAIARRMSVVGMPRLTEDSIEKFAVRNQQINELWGTPLYRWNDDTEKHDDYFLTFEDIHRRIGMWATTDKNLTDPGFKKKVAEEMERQADKKVSQQKREMHARNVIRSLEAGDLWTPACDEAARVLKLDPDNYRALPNENWPEEMHNKVTFDTGQAILDHADAILAKGK